MSASVLDLPIESHLPAIVNAVRQRDLVVLQAQPGSGKTTRIPTSLAQEADGQVWVLEPRRLAATLAAQHVAELRQERCGDSIGYRVRHDTCASAKTKVLFLTEGMFLRLLHGNPTLQGVSHLVIDEFHERHLQTDVAFTLARFLQTGRRPDLKIVVMSATLDIKKFLSAFPGARVFDIEGKAYPVATTYLGREAKESVVDAAVRGVVAMAESMATGNILAFLPGTSEILRVCERLRAMDLTHWGIFALTASVQPQTRAQIFANDGRRKIIVATNVAESSVTLPHIGGVVDTGVAKIPGHAAWSGLPTLELKRVPQSSCVQRQGRAGRTGPGKCFRMYKEADFLQREAFLAPEVQRLDMCEVVLELCQLGEAWQIADALSLDSWPWLDPPRQDLWDQAATLLVDLGAIANGRLSSKGAAMVRWPFHPRLSAIVEEGIAKSEGFSALAAACLLNEQGIFSQQGHNAGQVACDVTGQLRSWRRGGSPQQFDFPARQRFERDLRALLNLLPTAQREKDEIPELGPILFAGFFDRVARKREVTSQNPNHGPEVTYNFCLGRGGRMSGRSQVRREEFLLCLVASEDPAARSAATGTLIHMASAISPDWLLASGSPLLRESTEYRWHEGAQRVDAIARVCYGQLVLRESKLERASGASALLTTMLLQKWPKPFVDDGALIRYNGKVAALRGVGLDEDLPQFTGDMLQLLAEVICDGKRSFDEVAKRPLADYLRDQLSFEQSCLLDHLVPDHLRLANGRELPLRYAENGEVWVTGFVQDFFGLEDVLTVANGRVLVKAEMLGPHKRPVQVTGNLGAFWSAGYPSLAKELRGRYPRHHWPETPQNAPAVLTKSRLPK